MQDGKRLRGPRGLWLCVGLIAATTSIPALADDAPAEAADAKPVFLVTDVVVDDGVGIDKEAARDALANRFGRLREKIEVRSLTEVKSTLDRAAMAQMLGSSSSDEEVAKIGEYVAVDRLVFGRIHQVAGVTEVQVKIFNTKEGVTEIGLSRRLKAGAPPSLVLTLLDTLADGLLSFVVDAYTDGAPDAKFAALKSKKLERKSEEPAPAAGSAWSMLGVLGGVVAGAGVGMATVGGIGLADENGQAGDVPLILAGAGAGAVLVGTGLVIADGLTE
jgi:hypothetical protein